MAPPIILTAEHRYRHIRGHWDHLPAAEWCEHAHPTPDWKRAMLGDLPHKGETDNTVTTFAYVNHGRWIVGCPFCNSAQLAAKTDRRYFCAGEGGCGNAQVGGAFVNVVWPKDADAIEAELVKRADPNTRNWTPGETVKDLNHENVEHGVS